MKQGKHLFGEDEYWYRNHKLHRGGDLPAVSADGDKFWPIDGELHRVGNPSIIYYGGREQFYLDGMMFFPNEYWREIGKRYGLIIRNKTKI